MRASRKKAIFFAFAILSALTYLAIVRGYWRKFFEPAETTQNESFKEDDQPRETRDDQDYQHEQLDFSASAVKPRENIIIVAHGSSGSSITGDVFNHHNSVLYLHEPLQAVERIYKREGSTTEVSYKRLLIEVLTNIFRCNFNDKITQDFQYYYHEFSPRASIALSSQPFCPYNITDPRYDPKLCPPLKSEMLARVCRENYGITVVKILINRFNNTHIKDILEACNPSDIDCKVIFLMRDPRAIIASSRSHNFFRDPISDKERKGLRRYSDKKCRETNDILAGAQIVSSFSQDRIMMQLYEDFAMHPVNALKRYYKFAGLPEQKDVEEWLIRTTQPNINKEVRSECKLKGNYHEMCNVDDATQAVNRWRWKLPLEDIVIMEEYCQRTMRLLGYKPIDGSQSLMSNISIPLFNSNNYKELPKEWFLN